MSNGRGEGRSKEGGETGEGRRLSVDEFGEDENVHMRVASSGRRLGLDSFRLDLGGLDGLAAAVAIVASGSRVGGDGGVVRV